MGYTAGMIANELLWEVQDTGVQSAEANMRFDTHLLEEADRLEKPVLHLYEWAGASATYGYFLDPTSVVRLSRAEKLGLSLARRPTGGGMVFHLWDWAFSLVMPAHVPEFSINPLDNYAFVNCAVLNTVKEFSQGMALGMILEDFPELDPSCRFFCMAKPTKYDVMWQGKKIAGAAQRKTRKGFLHQGTLSLSLPDAAYLQELLIPGTAVLEAMRLHTFPLLGASASAAEITEAKRVLSTLLATHLSKLSLEYRSREDRVMRGDPHVRERQNANSNSTHAARELP